MLRRQRGCPRGQGPQASEHCQQLPVTDRLKRRSSPALGILRFSHRKSEKFEKLESVTIDVDVISFLIGPLTLRIQQYSCLQVIAFSTGEWGQTRKGLKRRVSPRCRLDTRR